MVNSSIKKRFPMFMLMFNLFLALLGQGIVIPILPNYLKLFNAAGTEAGYLVAFYGVAQFLFSPLGGRFSDKYGRKKMILLGMFFMSITEFVFSVSNSLFFLYLARFFGGIGLGIMFPSMLAYIADITTKETRARGMGYLSASMNLGILLGPGIGGLIAQFGVRIPYFAAASLSFCATLLTILLPETLSIEERKKLIAMHKHESICKQFIQSFQLKYFKYLLILLVMTIGLESYETVFSLYVQQKYEFTTKEISYLITLGAVIATIIQTSVIDKIVYKYREIKLIRFSLIMASVALFLMIFKINYIYIFIVSSIFFVFNALLKPILNTLISNEAGEDQGLASGLNTAYYSLGNIIGPLMSGYLFDIHINLPYIAGAIILLGAVSLAQKDSD